MIGLVGEPINPDAWKWLHQVGHLRRIPLNIASLQVVGEKHAAIVDTYWQTETVSYCLTDRQAVSLSRVAMSSLLSLALRHSSQAPRLFPVSESKSRCLMRMVTFETRNNQ